MKKAASWFVVHCAHWALLYAAFGLKLDGALYVLKFFAWFMGLLSWVLLTKDSWQKSSKQPYSPVRHYLSSAQAWVTLLLFVWFGHIVTAIAWLFVILCFAVHHSEVKKLRDAARGASSGGAT